MSNIQNKTKKVNIQVSCIANISGSGLKKQINTLNTLTNKDLSDPKIMSDIIDHIYKKSNNINLKNTQQMRHEKTLKRRVHSLY